MQAVLVLAHNNYDWVARLSKKLSAVFEVFIHFDMRLQLTPEQMEELNTGNIHCYQKIKVMWGGWTIGEATLFLMREILRNPDIGYVHVISGQDWPTIPVKEVYGFYEETDKIYMRSERARDKVKSGQNLLDWQKYYFNFDVVPRRCLFGKIYHHVIMKAQQLLHIDKLARYHLDMEIYQGANWIDIPRYALEYLIAYWDSHENVRKVFETGYCPDEFWVQTILEDSPYKDKIERNNHRYVVFEKKHGSYPAILDMGDYEQIATGDYHFMRKIVPQYSQEIVEKLERDS